MMNVLFLNVTLYSLFRAEFRTLRVIYNIREYALSVVPHDDEETN